MNFLDCSHFFIHEKSDIIKNSIKGLLDKFIGVEEDSADYSKVLSDLIQVTVFIDNDCPRG